MRFLLSLILVAVVGVGSAAPASAGTALNIGSSGAKYTWTVSTWGESYRYKFFLDWILSRHAGSSSHSSSIYRDLRNNIRAFEAIIEYDYVIEPPRAITNTIPGYLNLVVSPGTYTVKMRPTGGTGIVQCRVKDIKTGVITIVTCSTGLDYTVSIPVANAINNGYVQGPLLKEYWLESCTNTSCTQVARRTIVKINGDSLYSWPMAIMWNHYAAVIPPNSQTGLCAENALKIIGANSTEMCINTQFVYELAIYDPDLPDIFSNYGFLHVLMPAKNRTTGEWHGMRGNSLIDHISVNRDSFSYHENLKDMCEDTSYDTTVWKQCFLVHLAGIMAEGAKKICKVSGTNTESDYDDAIRHALWARGVAAKIWASNSGMSRQSAVAAARVWTDEMENTTGTSACAAIPNRPWQTGDAQPATDTIADCWNNEVGFADFIAAGSPTETFNAAIQAHRIEAIAGELKELQKLNNGDSRVKKPTVDRNGATPNSKTRCDYNLPSSFTQGL